MGAHATESVFLMVNRRLDKVRSATRPIEKVTVDNNKPMIVKWTKCEP